MSLREKIEREIRETGPIPFSRYMQLCLYDPELGYYSRNVEQFGKAAEDIGGHQRQPGRMPQDRPAQDRGNPAR